MEDAENAAKSLAPNNRKRWLLNQPNGLWDKCIIPYEWADGFGM